MEDISDPSDAQEVDRTIPPNVRHGLRHNLVHSRLEATQGGDNRQAERQTGGEGSRTDGSNTL